MTEPNVNQREETNATEKAPQPRLLHFLRDMIQSDLNEDCRRQFRRHSLRLSLEVQPLTEDFLPDGESFNAVSSDISLKGMAFVNPRDLKNEYVKVTFDHFGISVICSVQHNSSIGIDYPLFLVGVEFLDEYYQQ
jgi:hypothetical protein